MATKQSLIQAKYDSTHTKRVFIKLNLTHDKDILDFLDATGNKQGTVKAAIREWMKSHNAKL